MALCLIIGTAAVSGVAGTGMKTAASEGYKKKVKALYDEGKFEYITVGEISYHYTRPLRGSSRNIKGPVYSSIAEVKQSIEGNGENRILAVIRQQNNGPVNFILLKGPTANNNKYFDEKNPLKSCSIDPNLKTNQGGIVESSNLKVVRKNSNSFQIEDTNYRTIQTHKKILEIKVKNTKGTPAKGDGKLSGTTLCELLNHMAKEGRVPKDFPSILTGDSIRKDENENKNENTISSLSLSSSSSITSPVDEILLENDPTIRIDDAVVTIENNENEDIDHLPPSTNLDYRISSSTELATSQYETTIVETAIATATVTLEYDDEVIPVAMAVPVE